MINFQRKFIEFILKDKYYIMSKDYSLIESMRKYDPVAERTTSYRLNESPSSENLEHSSPVESAERRIHSNDSSKESPGGNSNSTKRYIKASDSSNALNHSEESFVKREHSKNSSTESLAKHDYSNASEESPKRREYSNDSDNHSMKPIKRRDYSDDFEKHIKSRDYSNGLSDHSMKSAKRRDHSDGSNYFERREYSSDHYNFESPTKRSEYSNDHSIKPNKRSEYSSDPDNFENPNRRNDLNNFETPTNKRDYSSDPNNFEKSTKRRDYSDDPNNNKRNYPNDPNNFENPTNKRDYPNSSGNPIKRYNNLNQSSSVPKDSHISSKLQDAAKNYHKYVFDDYRENTLRKSNSLNQSISIPKVIHDYRSNKSDYQLEESKRNTIDVLNNGSTIDAVKNYGNRFTKVENNCKSNKLNSTIDVLKSDTLDIVQKSYPSNRVTENCERQQRYDPGISCFLSMVTPTLELLGTYTGNQNSIEFRMRRKNKTVILQWEPFSGSVASTGISYLTVSQSVCNMPPYPIFRPISIQYNGINRMSNINIDPYSKVGNIKFYINSDGSSVNINIGDSFVIYGGSIDYIVD